MSYAPSTGHCLTGAVCRLIGSVVHGFISTLKVLICGILIGVGIPNSTCIRAYNLFVVISFSADLYLPLVCISRTNFNFVRINRLFTGRRGPSKLIIDHSAAAEWGEGNI